MSKREPIENIALITLLLVSLLVIEQAEGWILYLLAWFTCGFAVVLGIMDWIIERMGKQQPVGERERDA